MRFTAIHPNIHVFSIGAALSSLYDWHGRYDVVIIGAIPADLPTPMFPLTSDWSSYIVPSAINMFNLIIATCVFFKYIAAVNNDQVRTHLMTRYAPITLCIL